MSEDAPGNPGAVAWPDEFTTSVRVRSMQIKLHRWAGDDSSRRFGDLFNLVCDPVFLVHAWERVSTNRGARTAGIDKATAAQLRALTGGSPACAAGSACRGGAPRSPGREPPGRA